MRILARISLILGFLLLDGPFPPVGASESDDPPWKRLLTGENAKRVEELEKKIHELYQAGRYAEAREPARQALEIRSREQGQTHWQTISAKNNSDVMTQFAALPRDAQDALTEATKLENNELPKLRRETRNRDAIAVA